MNHVLMYFLKVNIAIALFYIFYRLVFYKDTFWSTRRFYLVFSILLSAVYPFISLSGWLEKQEPMQVFMARYVQLQEITITTRPVTVWTIGNILLATYVLVCLVLLIRMGVQLFSILRWKMKGKKQWIHGIEIVAIDEAITPFSFFNSIFLNPSLHTEQETDQILTHESTHARQKHSLDVLLSEIMTIVCWMNPAAWYLKHEIRHNLEFLADDSVLNSGFDSKNYQYHLLQLSYQTPEITLVNKFNVSPLKKRITMMNQQKTKKAGILKYSLIVPLALALILSSNAENMITSSKSVLKEAAGVITQEETIKPTIVETIVADDGEAQKNQKDITSQSEIPLSDNKIYTVVEEMPLYPGGESELLSYISRNLRYPIEAMEKGIQGKVIVRFVVNALGKVEKAEIVRGVNPSLDQAGLKVINSLPNWIPGKQNGKNVAVYYTLPISFKLDDSKPDKKAAEKARENWIKSLVVLVDGAQQPIGFDYRSIKQEDIESVNVLKSDTDEKRAELVAKYGENAGSGVIMITKKK